MRHVSALKRARRVADITRQLAAVTMEYLANQHRGKLGADRFELVEILDFPGVDMRAPAVRLQACRINNVIADAVRFELPVQPETVIAGLVTRHHFDRPTRLAANARSHLLDQLK